MVRSRASYAPRRWRGYPVAGYDPHMPYTRDYLAQEPTRADVDRTPGLAIVEFGARDCAFCVAAQPAIAQALEGRDVTHYKIEDGAGRPLGRTFGVKLWPTLVALQDGVEVGRVVRPRRTDELAALFTTG
jgi:thioredoxin 1